MILSRTIAIKHATRTRQLEDHSHVWRLTSLDRLANLLHSFSCGFSIYLVYSIVLIGLQHCSTPLDSTLGFEV